MATTTARPTTVPEILECAADLIEKRGLARRTFFDSRKGSFCTVGAMRQCAHGDVFGGPCWEAEKFLFDQLGVSVVKWNDNPNRRKSTIVRALRRFAKKYRGLHPEEG